jgi:hypothetical protein
MTTHSPWGRLVTLSSISRTLLVLAANHQPSPPVVRQQRVWPAAWADQARAGEGQAVIVSRTVDDMARIIVYIVLAVVAFALLMWLLAAFLNTLMIGFWIVLAVLLGFGLFRLGRRTGHGPRG